MVVILPGGCDFARRAVGEPLTEAKRVRGQSSDTLVLADGQPSRGDAGSETRVSVRHVNHAVELEVTDEGRGPAAGETGDDGLIGMRERASSNGSALEAGPRAGGGFGVRARLPLVFDAAGP